MLKSLIKDHLKILCQLIVFLSLLSLNCVSAQTIKGKVMDATTQKGLAFVHIGIMDSNMGTISKEDGSFEMNLGRISSNKSLHFSMLGYRSHEISLREIGTSFLEIKLEPISFDLMEVVVSSRNNFDTRKLGNYKNSKTTTGKSGDDEFGWGGEWGILIPKPEGEYKIKDVNFHLRFNTVDSVLFRVNIYRMSESDFPSQSMLTKPAFVRSQKGQKWISLNMEDRNLWVNGPIVVTMEWVRVWYAEKGENHLFFTHGKNKNTTIYSKENSFGTWQINQRPPLAIYVNGLFKE